MNYISWLNLKSKLLIGIIILNSLTIASAQNKSSDSIIFSIDDEVVYKTEFLNQYKKNNNFNYQNDSLSLDNYVDLYLKFKLKVKAAKDKGMDTLPKFVKEFESYRKQTADKYISNGKVTDEMVQDIYYRMTNEVNASHILLSLDAEATPADTLETYNTAIDLLKKIDKGEYFQELALKYSKDPSVRINKGNLAWFKAYKMVYPFETAAYQLEIGEVSQPVRTQFGYHLIKKNDERPSKGKLIVAHIMKSLKSQDSTYNAENEINQIYQKVMDGESFSDLAKQFSDHNPTASNGGELKPFSVGDINSQEFGDVAFSLDKNDSISKPFKTQFGWHIVKYIDNIPVDPLDKIKPEVIKRIKTSDRSSRLVDNIKKDLMQKYDVVTNYEVLSLMENRIDENIFKFKWIYNKKQEDTEVWVLKIEDHEFMLDEFLEYIQKQQRSIDDSTISSKLNTAMDKFTYAKLIQVHNQNLEKVSPDFAAEIKRYYEGLLLFEIMENQIWKPVQEDSLALKEYYEDNRNIFVTKPKIDAVLASSKTKKEAIKIAKEIEEEGIDTLKENYAEVIFQTLTETEIDDSALPKYIILQEDYTKVYNHNGQFICLYIKKLYPSEDQKFEDVRGEIINIFQKKKEDSWISQLKNKYDIYLNTDLIENLETNLEN